MASQTAGRYPPPPESKLTRFELPGFTLPINYAPNVKRKEYAMVNGNFQNLEFESAGEGRDLFCTALYTNEKTTLPLTTLREFTMQALMNEITDKPNWEKKVFDETVTAKWRAEILATEGRDVSEPMVDWVIAELQHRSTAFEKTGLFSVFHGDVVKSDNAVTESLKKTLQKAVAVLEDVPEVRKDWHPHSDNQVLDLIHPSLFPVIYGKTRILHDSLVELDNCVKWSGTGVVLQIPPETDLDVSPAYSMMHTQSVKPFSKNFQWLPCEVDISKLDGAKITSYINNLHPKEHPELYEITEKIISASIPLWNATLTPLKRGLSQVKLRLPFVAVDYASHPDEIEYDEHPTQGDDEQDDAYDERYNEWIEENTEINLPEPGVFSTGGNSGDTDHEEETEKDDKERAKDLDEANVDLRAQYGHRGLQVIVKLANIHLTPEKSSYAGGSWHVEGQMNEHIVATSLYYFDNENIEPSHLSFRQSVDTEIYINYPQNEHSWLTLIFGCEQDGPGTQEIGSVLCSEGRLLTFPNVLQHRVSPFKLADPTKAGHRKILALFLVDPNIRIISTANIPPQQREWWSKEFRMDLPQELRDRVVNMVDDFPIGLDEAKQVREQLMEERGRFVTFHQDAFSLSTFSLCEH